MFFNIKMKKFLALIFFLLVSILVYAKEVTNDNHGVANAMPGDYIVRSNGERVILNQTDIDNARRQLGITSNEDTMTITPINESVSSAKFNVKSIIYIAGFILAIIILWRIIKSVPAGVRTTSLNVRNTTATTISLIVLIAVLYFLIPWVKSILPVNILYIFNWRFQSRNFIGEYHSFILFASVWLIIVIGVLDIIFNNHSGTAIFSSLKVLIVLAIPVLIFGFIPLINVYVFWGLFYIVMIIGVLWTFKKFILINYPNGKNLMPFIKKISSGAGTGRNHISDRYAVFGISILLTGVYLLLLVSFIFYVVSNRMMFI